MTKLVDVSKLKDATVLYDQGLRTLPFLSFQSIAQVLGLNVMDIKGKHSLILERRKAGGTVPYSVGMTPSYLADILGYDPSIIEPKDTVFCTKENSKKYTDNELLVVGGVPVSNITKRHPMEFQILSALVKSHAEDVCNYIFFGDRDEAVKTPATAFNGLFTHIDDMITSSAIAAGNGNYAVTGAIVAPTTETDAAAYDILIDFIGDANPFLRDPRQGGPAQLLISDSVFKNVRDALKIKLKMLEYPTAQRVLECIREDSFCPDLEIGRSTILGTGSRLTLQKKGNMDVAFNSQAATKFCQVRDIFEDPNEWQFWLQSGYDTRVRDWHQKVFRTNEQKNTPVVLAGDYV